MWPLCVTFIGPLYSIKVFLVLRLFKFFRRKGCSFDKIAPIYRYFSDNEVGTWYGVPLYWPLLIFFSLCNLGKGNTCLNLNCVFWERAVPALFSMLHRCLKRRLFIDAHYSGKGQEMEKLLKSKLSQSSGFGPILGNASLIERRSMNLWEKKI